MSRPLPQKSRLPERRATRIVAALACLIYTVLAVGLALSDRADTFEEQLRIAREGLFPRQASGTIHMVEIDARSIATLNAWPWPRQVHAQLVDRLSAAGVKTIAFDVDFSAPSNPISDAAFAAALQRAGGSVILPTFRQRAGETGGFIENVPIAAFRQHSFLASVNVHPDADGIMRSFTYGTVTQGTARPAMPAMLAGTPGRIGESFPVNSAIAPDTIPRHSVSDILAGRVPDATLAGKTVLIGATAIELGDRYAMPRHGIQPGVVIQTLAAETLIQDLAFRNFGPAGPACLALALLILVARRRRHQAASGAGAIACLLALPLIVEWAGIGTVEVASAVIAISVGLIIILGGGAVAHYDALRLIDATTGLQNERALHRRLAVDVPAFLIVMRIKNFDEIAELMSQEQRYSLVEQTCERIALSGGDPEIFSLGNGRFAWTDARSGLDEVAGALEGLFAILSSRISVSGKRMMIAPAFGIAAGEDCSDPSHADLAASHAVASGSRWFVYSSELGGSTSRAQQLLADLDEAMTARDIMMVYQPKLTLASGRIDGVEALVRWQHATLGPIPPDQFIPVFEKSGHMAELTLYIVDRCIDTAERWQRLGLGTSIAINVSAPLFADQGFVAALFARIDRIGSLARLIAIEVTESAVVLDDARMIDALGMLRERGVKIAIDDYGTGQSTLSYLKKFPVDEIKIDQSFIRQLTSEASDRILVRSTIEMAHELGFQVTAEGVEDEACMSMLTGFGCDVVQGWHIGRGVKLEDIEPILLEKVAERRAA